MILSILIRDFDTIFVILIRTQVTMCHTPPGDRTAERRSSWRHGDVTRDVRTAGRRERRVRTRVSANLRHRTRKESRFRSVT